MSVADLLGVVLQPVDVHVELLHVVVARLHLEQEQEYVQEQDQEPVELLHMVMTRLHMEQEQEHEKQS